MRQPDPKDFQYLNETNTLVAEMEKTAEGRPFSGEVAALLNAIYEIRVRLKEATASLEMGHPIEKDKKEIDKLLNAIL